MSRWRISDKIAWTAIIVGVVLMVGAAVSCIEEGSGLVSWEHRRKAKLVILAGAGIAVGVPALVLTAQGLWRKLHTPTPVLLRPAEDTQGTVNDEEKKSSQG